jgi:hypothetical protein
MENYGKLVYIYDLKNRILIKKGDITIESLGQNLLKKPEYVLCFKITNTEDFNYNDLDITIDKFPWKTYCKLNPELSFNRTKESAWHHWYYYGKKEERSFSYINNTNYHRARFGNLFFLNICLHMLSQKFDLKCSYKFEKYFNKLGIYFNKGHKIYNKNILLTDFNFENILESDISPRNIIINNNVWFHTNRFCKMINEYFERNNLFINIIKNNLYRYKYNNNNDLFIHVRLGDVADKTSLLEKYYVNTIDCLTFNRGFIASDTVNHELCNKLIQKYNLTVFDRSEVETIMFGSTCKNIVLSGGTFSWLIGFLAMSNSKIFYPELQEKWYGDIFSFKNWNKIVLNQ